MKFVIIACFALGFFIGWWPGGKFLGTRENRGGEVNAMQSTGRVSGTINPSVSQVVRLTRDKVEISRAKLEELLSAMSPAQSFQDFMAGAALAEPERFDQLAKWSGLDAGEKRQLTEFLRQAATARAAWEKENVKVTSTGLGQWTLDIPGDDGKGRAELHRQLAAAFSPEKTAAIEAGGDLQNFFGFRKNTLYFQQGRVEVMARRRKGSNTIDPAGPELQLDVRVEDKLTTIWRGVDGLREPTNDTGIPGLPGWDAILKSATEAARVK